MAGGVVATLLLAATMALTIRALHAAAEAQVSNLRAKEYEITLMERLRWRGEVIISAGRGYLITGDPKARARLRHATFAFNSELLELTSNSSPTSSAPLVAAGAGRIIRAEKHLVSARQQMVKGEPWRVEEEEDELLPLQLKLEAALQRVVARKEAVLDDIYATAANERDHFTAQLYALLAVLTLVGLVITWLFARRIAAAYRAEERALDIARKALTSRDELMGVVAHDLRNPLQAIQLKAAALRRLADAPEMVRREAKSIENIMWRMEFLTGTMLDITMIEAGRFAVIQESCAVEDLLREVDEMFSNAAASKGVRFLQPEGGVGILIHADHERALEVLSNLLGNALKFASPGGEIALSIEPRDTMLRFAVSDSGPGIAAEHLPHLFDRFWKSDVSGKNGTGLGLFIAKGIVEAHGGRIWAANEPGRGTTFYFTLPIADPAL